MPFQKIRLNNPRTDKLIQWTYFVVAPVLLGVVIAALFFSITTNNSLKSVADRVQQLSQDNKQLSEQNKKLAEQNKDLNTQTQGIVAQNRDYIRCLADTFAQYTRDQRPIDRVNLDQCEIRNDMQDSSSRATPTSSGQVPSDSGGSSISSTSSNSTPNDNGTQSDNSQSGDNNKSPQPVKVLGIPVCVPLTDVCVKQ